MTRSTVPTRPPHWRQLVRGTLVALTALALPAPRPTARVGDARQVVIDLVRGAQDTVRTAAAVDGVVRQARPAPHALVMTDETWYHAHTGTQQVRTPRALQWQAARGWELTDARVQS